MSCFRIGQTNNWVATIPFDQNRQEQDSSSPLAIHFCIDNSGSMGWLTEQIKNEFSVVVDSAASSPCSLTLFGNQATTLSGNITSAQEMRALPGMPQGATNIPAGVRRSLETIVFKEIEEINRGISKKTHHVLVLLTDGAHNTGPYPEVEFPKIGKECLKLVPDVQLSVVIVGVTRSSSTSMGMRLKTHLETVPLDDHVENIYFASTVKEMKTISDQLIDGLNSVSKGRVHSVTSTDGLIVSDITAPPKATVSMKSTLTDSNLTMLIKAENGPKQIILDGTVVELVETDQDHGILGDILAKHIDKTRVQRVASSGDTSALRSGIEQLGQLINAMEEDLKRKKNVSELTLEKVTGAQRLAQNRFITKTLHCGKELRNQLAEVANFAANCSQEQAAFLNGRKSKFATKALRRAAVRSGDDVVLDPEKEMAKVRKEVVSKRFAKSIVCLLRTDTISQLSRLSESQIKKLKDHVKADSPSGYLQLLRLLKHDEVANFSTENTMTGERKVPAETKVHTSALCWIPPAGCLRDAIQAIRQKHDRQINRWPPHVNLLYPFVPVSEFERAATKLAKALSTMAPFNVTMQEIDYFAHNNKAYTAWLHPDVTQEFVSLQSMCQMEFPDCDDVIARGAFVPHLTVGQCTSKAEVGALVSESQWKAASTQCGEICLISREGSDGPFQVHWRVQFGNPVPLLERASTSTTEPSNDRSRPVETDPLMGLDGDLKDFVDSGQIAGYINEVFFGDRKSYLSLSNPWEHIAEWKDLADSADFQSQWEMLLYAGSMAYPISVERSAGSQMNPFQMKVTKIHTTVIDTASLCCANHSDINTYGPEGGEPIQDALVLVDPSCPRASAKIVSSKLLGKTFTSVVVSRDLHMYTGASMKIALLANSLFRCLQPETTKKSKTDAIAEIRRQFLGKAYQCGACGVGPVDHGGCSDLFSHHGEVDRAGVVASNACPFCGWFSGNLSDWEPWDGTVPPILLEERCGDHGDQKEEVAKPLAAKMDLVLRIVYSFRKQFCQSQNTIKEFYDALAKKLTDWDLGLTTQDGVDGLEQVLLAAMACDMEDAGNVVEAAFEPPVILGIVNEACARAARKKFRMAAGGDDSEAQKLAAKHVTIMLGVTAETAPETTGSLLEPEPDRAVVEASCSRDYVLNSELDQDWAMRVAKRWCNAMALGKALRASLIRRGGGWERLERDMETSLENYEDVVQDLQNTPTADVWTMCDIEKEHQDRTFTTMAAQAFLYNKGSSRQELPDVRSCSTLADIACDMRMLIYTERVKEKMAEWSDMGEQLTFLKARAADIGQYSSMITGHVHGLDKETFWGLWEAAICDNHGGEKVRTFLETANPEFSLAHTVGNGLYTGKKKKKRKKKKT